MQRIPIHKGQHLEVDDVFIEVETDKIDIAVPSPIEGRVLEIEVEVGQIVTAGETLVWVDSSADEKTTELQLDTQDLMTAIKYLSDLDSAHLCSRTELQNLTFGGFKGFIEEAGELALAFSSRSLAKLDLSLQEELRAVFYFVTDLTKMLVGFSPRVLGFKKYREHRRIYDALSQDSEFSLQSLRELLSRVGIENLQPDAKSAYVFISYSHDDAKAAFEIATKLREARVAHFLDRRIGFGEPIPARVHEEIGKATHLIAYISPASIKSPWVHYELGFARAREVPIIPYLLHPGIQDPLFLASERSVSKDDKDEEAKLFRDLSAFKRSDPPGTKQLMIRTWKSSFAKERIGQAMQIWHQSMASYASMEDAKEALESFVKRGGLLRCILSDPAGRALERSAIRNLKETSSVQKLADDFEETRKLLASIARRATSKDAVVLKAIDFVPEPIVTLVDPLGPTGVAFVTLSGFRQPPNARPQFFLSKQQQQDWFEFYCRSFLELWDHSGAKTINLNVRDRIL